MMGFCSAYCLNDGVKTVGSEHAINQMDQTLPISKGTLWVNDLQGQFVVYCYSSSHVMSVYAKFNYRLTHNYFGHNLLKRTDEKVGKESSKRTSKTRDAGMNIQMRLFARISANRFGHLITAL